MKKLTYLLMAGALALVSASQPQPVTLFTIGDSTMSENKRYEDDPGDPGRGWVQGLQQFLDPSKMVIRNFAVSGRSTKSFIDEGKWENVLKQMKQGDFLLVQFGHNDAKDDPKRYTDPETTFKDNLRLFVNQAREKGVTPVIATSIARRRFNKDSTVRDTHGRYAPAAAEVAEELKVPLVDMNRLSTELIAKAGPEESKKYYLWVGPNVCERFPDGTKDDTHLGVEGAEAFSRLFAGECVATKNPLAPYITGLE